MRKFYLLIFIGIVLSSCLEPPEITEIKDIEISEVQDSTLHVNFITLIDNPNKINLKAESITFDIVYDKYVIGNGELTDELVFKKKSVTPIHGQADVNVPQLLNHLPEGFSGDDIEVTLKVEISISKLKVKVNKEVIHYVQVSNLVNKSVNGAFF